MIIIEVTVDTFIYFSPLALIFSFKNSFFTFSDNTYVDFILEHPKIILVLGSSLFLHLFHQCSLSLSKKPFSSFCQENPSKVCKLFIEKFHSCSCSLSKVCESGLSFFLLYDLLFFYPTLRSQILKCFQMDVYVCIDLWVKIRFVSFTFSTSICIFFCSANQESSPCLEFFWVYMI